MTYLEEGKVSKIPVTTSYHINVYDTLACFGLWYLFFATHTHIAHPRKLARDQGHVVTVLSMAKGKKSGLFVDLPKSIVDSLVNVETHQGMPVQDYLRLQATKAIMETVPAIFSERERERDRERERKDREERTGRGPGRPARPTPPRLPDDIERGTVKSGFVGVYQDGKFWKAYYDKGDGALGLFDTPEDAAIARYWYTKGRLSIAVDALRKAGAPQEDLEAQARSLGALVPKKPFEVGARVNYDPVIGEGPITRGHTITGGPVLEGGAVYWQLDGNTELVRQEDLEWH